MSSIKYPKGICSISDEWTYKGMQVVWMENDWLKIGVLVGRGADIFEFKYKPFDLDFMLRLNKGIHNPVQVVSQMRDTTNQMEDYYYGGWQEILPNSLPGTYRGAKLGQHGEVWMIPWNHSILEQSNEKVVLKLWTRPLRIPILIERVLTLFADQPSMLVEEQLTNESRTDLDIMWGHHIAFGLPFLADGGYVETNARKIIAEESMPPNRKFKPGLESRWPIIQGLSGEDIDAQIVPPASDPPFSELAYLSGFDKVAYYKLLSPDKKFGFSLQWDAEIFKYLWYWQERYATQDAPWWGSAYAIALEPWTGRHPADVGQAIEDGHYLKIKSGSVIYSTMEASIVDLY